MRRHIVRYNYKAPTTHKQPYTIFNPHDGPAPWGLKTIIESALSPSAAGSPQNQIESYIYIMSVDPGIRNCGVRIEQRRLVNDILVHVNTIMMVRINFNENDPLEHTDPETQVFQTAYYTRSTNILDNYLPYIIQCQYILIESQLPINYSMVRMSQHLITYLSIRVKNTGNRPLIIEIDPHLKSRLLNAPTKMSKPQLKKWCRQKALDILFARNDMAGHDAIIKAGKGDDMGDTVCQCEAWWVILCGQLHAPPLPNFSGAPAPRELSSHSEDVSGDRPPLHLVKGLGPTTWGRSTYTSCLSTGDRPCKGQLSPRDFPQSRMVPPHSFNKVNGTGCVGDAGTPNPPSPGQPPISTTLLQGVREAVPHVNSGVLGERRLEIRVEHQSPKPTADRIQLRIRSQTLVDKNETGMQSKSVIKLQISKNLTSGGLQLP
jgi:hypothetical protein